MEGVGCATPVSFTHDDDQPPPPTHTHPVLKSVKPNTQQRAVNIKVKAQDEEGRPVTLTLNDFVARIFQHEYDHLQGTLFHDRMAPEVLEEVREKLVDMEEAYLKEHPGAAVRRVGGKK